MNIIQYRIKARYNQFDRITQNIRRLEYLNAIASERELDDIEEIERILIEETLCVPFGGNHE